MNNRLISQMMTLSIPKEKGLISEEIFKRSEPFTLLDKYQAYQALEDEWKKTSIDLEIIQSEGFDAVRIVDPNIVIKKKNNKEEEVQDGWVGRIIPFSIVQKTLLKPSLDFIQKKESEIMDITSQVQELLDSLQEEDKEQVLNNDNTAFDSKKVKAVYKDLDDDNDEESLKNKLKTYMKLKENEKKLKKEVKVAYAKLIENTKSTIERLTDSEALKLIKIKWIQPIVQAIESLPQEIIQNLNQKIKYVSNKYQTTYAEVDEELESTQQALTSMLDELDGDVFDLKGLQELKKLIDGE